MQNFSTYNRSNLEQAFTQQYNAARKNLLLVVVFSAINVMFLVLDSFSYFLFSASFPYMLVDLGKYLCGMYPAEYYVGDLEAAFFLPPSVYYVLLSMAAVIIVLYLLCFLFSKNGKVGWLIFALVFFGLDTVGMFVYFQIGADMVLDVLFHIWVLVLLCIGIRAHFMQKKLPPEPEVSVDEGEETEGSATADSPVLRKADLSVKFRTLLTFDAWEHTILYRRLKGVNELVIDGNVYAEYITMVELTHALSATLDGHTFEVGYDGVLGSYGKVDGRQVAQKRRWY